MMGYLLVTIKSGLLKHLETLLEKSLTLDNLAKDTGCVRSHIDRDLL